jgi:hypothetical protein
MERLGKHVPVETVSVTNELCYLADRDNWSQPSQFCTGVCEEKSQLEEKDLSAEAEESPLLEAVTRERLVKI